MFTRRALAGVLWVACAIPVCAEDKRFTAELWADITPIYQRSLQHPFLQGLADGSLRRERFQFYLIQDSHYLDSFSKVLKILAAKAPRKDWAALLNRHAVDALSTERQLHESVLGSFGVTQEAVNAAPVAPSNYAYMNHLMSTASQQSFAKGIAAVLPCYWIYWEVGKELQRKGSRDPNYQRWITAYADQDYGAAVQQVLDIMDAEATHMDPDARRTAKDLFRTSARYEWMFWDMAWREEKWLP